MYGMPASYDRWKTREPDYPRPVTRCAQCKDEIYKGDEVYNVDGGLIHTDCFEDYARKVLSPSLEYVE